MSSKSWMVLLSHLYSTLGLIGANHAALVAQGLAHRILRLFPSPYNTCNHSGQQHTSGRSPHLNFWTPFAPSWSP